MTDDTHDQHDHTMDAPLEEGHGAGETWHDQPVDGFSDDPGSATVSEEHDHGGDHLGEAVPEARKRNPLMATIIVIGGLVVLGGVGYWQFGNLLGGKKALNAPVMITDSTPKPAKSQDIPGMTMPTGSDNTVVAPRTNISGTPNNPAPIASPTSPMGQVGTALPAGTTMPPQVAAQAPVTEPQVTANNPPNAAPNNVAPVNTLPPIPLAPVQGFQTAAATFPPAGMPPQMQRPMMGNPPATVDHAAEARMVVLASRVDDMQKSLQDATQKLSEISEKLSAAPAPVAAANNPMLDDRLAKLEQKLAQIEHHAGDMPVEAAKTTSKPLISPTVASANDTTPVADESVMTEPTTKPVLTPARTTRHHTASHTRHVAHHSARHHHAVAQRHNHTGGSVAGTKNWILRAASADQAWIAKSETESDIRPVHVGDDVPGIGKVEAITETNGGWAIKGSHGTIQ